MIINSNTLLFVVMGDPVSHSLSPVMHNQAFQEVGYNGVYLAIRVKHIGAALAGIKNFDVKGASITIPHKVSVMEFLDELDDNAEKIGAVNTIVNRGGILTGYNTDYLGAVKALFEKTSIKGKDVVIIGAGGAARAIGFGIISNGGNVTITNRTEKKGEKLAADLGSKFLPLSALEKIGGQILINTTAVGMTPEIDAMPIKEESLDRSMVVMDVVYNPLKTRLLKAAENIGCTIVDGLSMFVYQGACQFELWTNKRAPVEAMRKAVLKALQVKSV